ncbi:MAG: class I SAM-dependent methyltransferase [Candidatus Omnitrophota bacterium]
MVTAVNLRTIYQRRFNAEREFRNRMWRVLCRYFFQRFIPEDAVVLEIGAGHCEFINNICAKKKIALDLKPDIKNFANSDIEIIQSTSTDMFQIRDNSCDIIFTSNFFEHLSKENIIKTLKEARRILKMQGKFLVIQPNIRYCYKDYWNFFDHITPLDDLSLSEVLETNGFKILECRPKFLPYSTKSRFPKIPFLVRIYLKIKFLHSIFGKQLFICAEKI